MSDSGKSAAGAATPGNRPKPGFWRRACLAAVLLGLPGMALGLLYAPALDYDYVWTDTSAIGGRSMLRPPGEIAEAFREPLHRIPHRSGTAQQRYYRPAQVAMLSWVDQHFESKPRSFRSAGLVIGVACLALFSFFAWRLLGSRQAALTAALFVACHPVGIEAYVWIAGISGAMCALFLLAALAFGLASCRPRSPLAFAGLCLLSLLALAAALLTKERAVVEPALLLALFATSVRSGSGSPGKASAAGLLHRPRAAVLLALHGVLVAVYAFVWRPIVFGGGQLAQPTLGNSWITQFASFEPLALLGISLVLFSAAAFWLCLRHGRPVTALGIAWIWIAYAPTSDLVPLLHANGERYLFLSAFGASLIVADLVAALGQRTRRGAGIAVAILAVAFLAQRTAHRIPDWESNLDLFQQEIARDPAYREAYFLVAVDLANRGRTAEAETRLRPLLTADPRFDGTAGYSNLLSVNELACSLAFTLRHYDDVLDLEQRLRREHPAVLKAAPLRTCIGQANNALGNTQRAVELFTGVANELGSTTPPLLYVMIARAYFRLGDTDSSQSWLERARAAAGSDPFLLQKIRKIERQLARATRGSRPPTRR